MVVLLLAIIIYLPLAYLIYKGKRWAILTTIFIWSIDKGYQIIILIFVQGDVTVYAKSVFWVSLIWYCIYMKFFWRAYQVEEVRGKIYIKQEEKIFNSINEDNRLNKTEKINSTNQSHKINNKKYFYYGVSAVIIIVLLIFSIKYIYSSYQRERSHKYTSCLDECDDANLTRTQESICKVECIKKYK